MNKYLYQYARMCDPFITPEEVEDYIEVNEWDLIIKFKDGRQFIYDRFTNTHKNLYYNNINELTDKQEKKEFAYRLRSLMGRRWVTQEQLANDINVSRPMISKYVRGEAIPSAIVLRKIAKVLNCSMDDFFDRDY